MEWKFYRSVNLILARNGCDSDSARLASIDQFTRRIHGQWSAGSSSLYLNKRRFVWRYVELGAVETWMNDEWDWIDASSWHATMINTWLQRSAAGRSSASSNCDTSLYIHSTPSCGRHLNIAGFPHRLTTANCQSVYTIGSHGVLATVVQRLQYFHSTGIVKKLKSRRVFTAVKANHSSQNMWQQDYMSVEGIYYSRTGLLLEKWHRHIRTN